MKINRIKTTRPVVIEQFQCERCGFTHNDLAVTTEHIVQLHTPTREADGRKFYYVRDIEVFEALRRQTYQGEFAGPGWYWTNGPKASWMGTSSAPWLQPVETLISSWHTARADLAMKIAEMDELRNTVPDE